MDAVFRCEFCPDFQETVQEEDQEDLFSEIQDQRDILSGRRLPKISSKGAAHAQRLLLGHSQMMAADEGLVYKDAQIQRHAETLASKQSSYRPVSRPRQSLGKSYSLRDGLVADVEPGGGDSFTQAVKKVPSAIVSKRVALK